MLKDQYGHYAEQDPDAVEDYQIDWSLWLGSETIVDSQWSATGLTISASGLSTDARRATVVIGGGTCGNGYRVRNRVTTNGGRVNDQSFELWMVQR